MSTNQIHTVGHAAAYHRYQAAVQSSLPEKLTPRVITTRHSRTMDMGHRIARARARAGMSQTELANAIGVSRGLVGQWESHKKLPGRANLKKVADALLVSVEALLSGDHLDDGAVLVSDPDALKMLRAFKRMSARQRKNVIELFRVSADISREVQEQPAPVKGEIAVD